MLVLDLRAFGNKKYAAQDRFHGNGPNGKIPTKKDMQLKTVSMETV